MGLESLDHGQEAGVMVSSVFAETKAFGRRLARYLGRSSEQPQDPLAVYFQRSSICGLNGLTLFLSFDCDTDWDIDVVAQLDAFLKDRNIVPTYAVPGAQLQRGRDVYAGLARSGREFMNHGARAHAEWKGDQYVPVTFYQDMTEDEIVADIELGHRIVHDVTGTRPFGFRAPHFGGFQRDEDLDLIYRTIGRLNYSYSSTTVPEKALVNGPAWRVGEIMELPTSGSARYPHLILDTWTQLTDRRQYALGESYYELFAETLDTFVRGGKSALLTWYGDPSHSWGQTAFLKSMDLIAKRGIPSVSGSDAAVLCARAPSIGPQSAAV
ncbi:polysaccharide deacetylase family protein [Bradyrhizobium retamae]|uniref:polysaccharide deacetylase family protein n=1 Tax=Bradyrhizobium retamae TaxID=1300035 RepID=UPI00070E9D60|nr:polysaccharide deacetylase family protein [Bradyrhizobium retamae]